MMLVFISLAAFSERGHWLKNVAPSTDLFFQGQKSGSPD